MANEATFDAHVRGRRQLGAAMTREVPHAHDHTVVALAHACAVGTGRGKGAVREMLAGHELGVP
jgi:hypothetical protein